MKSAYLDCFSGISGDMLIGALLDAGLPFEKLRAALRTLPLEGYSLESERVERTRLYGTRFKVRQSFHEHPHRNLSDIKGIIGACSLSHKVKEKSIAVFERLAGVEAAIHNVATDEVRFHEVGAVDSIIDIVGAVFGIEFLGIESIHVSSLPLGQGFTECAHGRIPLPAPATLALLKEVPVYSANTPFELVTPTGAALAKELAESFGHMPAMTLETTGYGAGTRDLPDRPNLLRIIIGRQEAETQADTVAVLETDIDDASPEWMGFAMERLFESGALDVTFLPAQMKKNRPGVHVQVVCVPHLANAMMDVLFAETGTLGIRHCYSQRRVLKRSSAEVDSPWGIMKVKKAVGVDGRAFLIPEYEECRRIATQKGLPLRDIYSWVSGLNHNKGYRI